MNDPLPSYIFKSSPKWGQYAFLCARDACLNRFEYRRGVWHMEDCDVIVIFDNSPTKVPAIRQCILARLRAALANSGIEQLAEGSYPTRGEAKGYTWATVLNAGRDRIALVNRLLTQAIHDGLVDSDAH